MIYYLFSFSLNDYDLQWAETENKCPCCKERFNRIDRVKKLSLPATPPSSRRGKRKRDNTAANSGSNTRRRTSGMESSEGGGSSPSRAAAAGGAASSRVNSRTVEDRNQQHLPAGLTFAVLESIFNSAFMSATGLNNPSRAGGAQGGGRTTFRFPVPPSMAGDGDVDDMANMLRMILQDAAIGRPGGRSFTVQVRRTGPDGADLPPPAAAARASGGAAAAAAPRASSGRSSSSPRRRAASSRASSNNESRGGRQRSSLFSYFSSSSSSRRSRSSAASGVARSSNADRPASRSDSGVIDLANSDSD